MREHITFDFIYDNHFAELREMEMLQNKLNIAAMAEPYVGKYFSVYQVRNRLLGYTDGEIKEIDQQISYERNVGIIPDPNAQMNAENEEEMAQQDNSLEAVDDLDLSGDPMADMGAPQGGGGMPPGMGGGSIGGGMGGIGGGGSPGVAPM